MTLQSKIKADGTTPWCMAVESGSASGWAGSDFQKEIALSTMGPTAYDQWWQGKLKWTSSDSKTAWTTFGQVLGPNDSNVYGGANYIINTNFGNVGDPMFQTPPKCNMLNQASFITDFFVKANPSLKAGTDFNFFPLPDVSTKYAGSHVVAADSWAMFNDTPAARSLMQAWRQALAEQQDQPVRLPRRSDAIDRPAADRHQDRPLRRRRPDAGGHAGGVLVGHPRFHQGSDEA
jgi:alpha-glucoside transport system substrate-binding protein